MVFILFSIEYVKIGLMLVLGERKKTFLIKI